MAETFNTREEWLTAATEAFRDKFTEIGHPLPDKVRVSTGWGNSSSRGGKSTIGWAWASGAATDKVNNVFISPTLSDPVQILATLVHELVHVADNCKNGHGPIFKRIAVKMGLQGPMTATTAGDELVAELKELADTLGTYPHGALNPTVGRKKQTTRLIKYTCPHSEDFKVRITRGVVAEFGAPICPCHEESMIESFL